MISTKIQKKDDDAKHTKNKGSTADEQAAMKALCKKSGRSAWYHKSRPHKPGRGVSGTKNSGGGRGRSAHKKDFSGLVEYCVEGKEKGEHVDGEGRTGHVISLNSPVAEDGQKLTAAEAREVGEWMGDTASQNMRARASAALHYVISLPPTETAKATPKFWDDVAARALEALDMKEHELLLIEHVDTDHRHAHIIINRINPISHLAKTTWEDLYALEKMTHEVEKKYGLQKVEGRLIDHNTGERYTPEKLKQNDRPKKRGPRGGVKEFERELKKKLGNEKPFSSAESWHELDQNLQKFGYELEQKGGGLMIRQTNLSDKNEKDQKQVTSIKMSQIAGKNNGKSKLEERFGEAFVGYKILKEEAKKAGISVPKLELLNQQKAQAQSDKMIENWKGYFEKPFSKHDLANVSESNLLKMLEKSSFVHKEKSAKEARKTIEGTDNFFNSRDAIEAIKSRLKYIGPIYNQKPFKSEDVKPPSPIAHIKVEDDEPFKPKPTRFTVDTPATPSGASMYQKSNDVLVPSSAEILLSPLEAESRERKDIYKIESEIKKLNLSSKQFEDFLRRQRDGLQDVLKKKKKGDTHKLKNGVFLIETMMKNRGIEVPEDPFVKPKIKPKVKKRSKYQGR